jgi:plasmid maintenance system antidote protein VapI
MSSPTNPREEAATMTTPRPPLTPAAIRGALAERRILKYEFAHQLGMHPQRLGALLNEREKLPPELAERIRAALEADDERRSR